MALDFSNWAVVAHKDDSGFGRQAADMRAVLGIGHHLVVPSERLSNKPISGTDERMLLPDMGPTEVKVLLDGLEGIIGYERHTWHPHLTSVAKQLGIKVVWVPNWEWFNGGDKEWRNCDFFICPSAYALSVVRGFGWRNSVHLPWTIDLSRFPARQVTGPARLFIHNAGLVDNDDRKGTRDTIEAFKMVKRDDIRLIVRLQKGGDLPGLDERIDVRIGNVESPEQLYAEGDAAVQPSKLEGIGFMVFEPVVSGIPTITTDYPPMNELVRQPQLLVRKRWFKRKSYGSVWYPHAHLRLPDRRDIARKIEWAAENDLASVSTELRSWAEEVFDPDKLRAQWSDVLEGVVGGRFDA